MCRKIIRAARGRFPILRETVGQVHHQALCEAAGNANPKIMAFVIDACRQAGVVNARFIRPLDEALLAKQAADTRLFVTLENGAVAGGFGAGVEESLRAKGFRGRVMKFGWPDEFIPHGSQEALLSQYGLTSRAIATAIATAEI